ncbi:MAG: hypothetical protein Q7N87_03800 [Candidatus Uhrbacteria bacterium]|nr:hypothetical protein [Candidatus Uhrbacteria bacterium]
MKVAIATGLAILVVLTGARIVFAVDQSSSNFQNLDSTFIPALFDASSSGFQITGSIEPITGLSTSVTYILRHGVLLKEVVVTPPPPPPPPPSPSPSPSPTPSPSPSGGGGGGGGQAPAPATSVAFSGRAYPLSHVTVLKDGQIAITSIAGPDANFLMTLSGLSGGTYQFAVYGEDNKGRRSSLFVFPVIITPGTTTQISGIFISPTIDVEKLQVKRGENEVIFGQSAPRAEVVIAVNSTQELFVKVLADPAGAYLYNLDTSPLELGQHAAKSKSAFNGEVSSFSRSVGFEVSQMPSQLRKSACGKADLNCYGRVNLIDFSIAAFWYKRTLSASFKTIETERLNNDGKITLVDFSIMAYYWTG